MTSTAVETPLVPPKGCELVAVGCAPKAYPSTACGADDEPNASTAATPNTLSEGTPKASSATVPKASEGVESNTAAEATPRTPALLTGTEKAASKASRPGGAAGVDSRAAVAKSSPAVGAAVGAAEVTSPSMVAKTSTSMLKKGLPACLDDGPSESLSERNDESDLVMLGSGRGAPASASAATGGSNVSSAWSKVSLRASPAGADWRGEAVRRLSPDWRGVLVRRLSPAGTAKAAIAPHASPS